MDCAIDFHPNLWSASEPVHSSVNYYFNHGFFYHPLQKYFRHRNCHSLEQRRQMLLKDKGQVDLCHICINACSKTLNVSRFVCNKIQRGCLLLMFFCCCKLYTIGSFAYGPRGLSSRPQVSLKLSCSKNGCCGHYTFPLINIQCQSNKRYQ